MSSKPALSTSAPSSSASGRLPSGARLGQVAQSLTIPALSVLGFFVVWQLAVAFFEIPVYLLPAPSVILVDSIGNFGTLVGHTLVTLKTVLLGFAASVLISLPLAIAITSSPKLAAVIYPLLVMTQAIPKVALAPILVILLGTNELPRVVVTFLVAFFPLVIAVATGLLAVPKDLIELGRSYRGSWLRLLWRIKLPYAVPMIFSGLKVAVTLSVVGAVVGEFVNADAGLGYFIITSTAFFQTPLAFSALIILSVMGIVLFQLVAWTERRFFPWSSGNAQTLVG